VIGTDAVASGLPSAHAPRGLPRDGVTLASTRPWSADGSAWLSACRSAATRRSPRIGSGRRRASWRPGIELASRS